MRKYRKGLYQIVSVFLCLTVFVGCNKEKQRSDPEVVGNQAKVTSVATQIPEPTESVAIWPTGEQVVEPVGSGIVIDREKHEEDNSNRVKDTWTLLIYLLLIR